jgi:DhnA family fructose-bisphosphate aldolase class Ia
MNKENKRRQPTDALSKFTKRTKTSVLPEKKKVPMGFGGFLEKVILEKTHVFKDNYIQSLIEQSTSNTRLNIIAVKAIIYLVSKMDETHSIDEVCEYISKELQLRPV